MNKDLELALIEQKVLRYQLKMIHIKWKLGSEYYEAKIKERLYPLEDYLVEKGILHNSQPKRA